MGKGFRQLGPKWPYLLGRMRRPPARGPSCARGDLHPHAGAAAVLLVVVGWAAHRPEAAPAGAPWLVQVRGRVAGPPGALRFLCLQAAAAAAAPPPSSGGCSMVGTRALWGY